MLLVLFLLSYQAETKKKKKLHVFQNENDAQNQKETGNIQIKIHNTMCVCKGRRGVGCSRAEKDNMFQAQSVNNPLPPL